MPELPGPNHVDVWTLSWPAFSNVRADFEALLSLAEREHIRKLRFERDRIAFASVRAALRLILAEYLHSAPDALQFGFNAHGKPYINGCSLQFNVSHSVDCAVIAVTELKVRPSFTAALVLETAKTIKPRMAQMTQNGALQMTFNARQSASSAANPA